MATWAQAYEVTRELLEEHKGARIEFEDFDNVVAFSAYSKGGRLLRCVEIEIPDVEIGGHDA